VKSDVSWDQRRYLERSKILPAITAVSAVATITATAPIATIAAAATPSTTAAMSTATTAEATAPATTATALLLRARFIDHQIAATEVLTVQRIHRAVGFFIVGNFDESKTARLSRETITNQIDCGRVDTRLREKFMKRIFRGGKRKIPNVKLLHLRTPFARNRDACRGARWKVELPLRASEGPKLLLNSRVVSTALLSQGL